MSRRVYLGELEELILLMVALIGADAYGVWITKELEEQTGRVISISAVHAALHRLEEKGFVKSKIGGASIERGFDRAGRTTKEIVSNHCLRSPDIGRASRGT
jgi:PadR family transcriptional regulator, regulatory protein PadR